MSASTSLVHSPSPHCGPRHCYTCHVDHIPSQQDFRHCPHCNHIYRTAKQLTTRYREQAMRLDMYSLALALKDPGKISNCMECLRPF